MTGFKIVMVLTFIAAFVTMLLGVFNMGKSNENDGETEQTRSNAFMFARVFFSFALFAEIVIYLFFIR